jgi:hypothetical protein
MKIHARMIRDLTLMTTVFLNSLADRHISFHLVPAKKPCTNMEQVPGPAVALIEEFCE